MPNTQTTIANQVAALKTSDGAAVKVVFDAIDASNMSAAEKASAHQSLDARVVAINGNR